MLDEIKMLGLSGFLVVGSSCCSLPYPLQDSKYSHSSVERASGHKTPLEQIIDSVHCIRVAGLNKEGVPFVGYGSGFSLSYFEEGTLVTTSAHVVDAGVGSTNVTYSIVESRSDNNVADDVVLTVFAQDDSLDTSIFFAPQKLSLAANLRVGGNFSFRAGDEAFIVGYPMGIDRWITKGIIANTYADSYLLDINVNFGNSGGMAISPLGDGTYALVGQVKACLAQEFYLGCKEFGVIQAVHTLIPFWEKYTQSRSI